MRTSTELLFKALNGFSMAIDYWQEAFMAQVNTVGALIAEVEEARKWARYYKAKYDKAAGKLADWEYLHSTNTATNTHDTEIRWWLTD